MNDYERALKFVINNLEASQEYLLMIRDEILDRTAVFGEYEDCDTHSKEFVVDLAWITLDYIDWQRCPELECIRDDTFGPIANVCEVFSQDEEVQAAVLRILVLEEN